MKNFPIKLALCAFLSTCTISILHSQPNTEPNYHAAEKLFTAFLEKGSQKSNLKQACEKAQKNAIAASFSEETEKLAFSQCTEFHQSESDLDSIQESLYEKVKAVRMDYFKAEALYKNNPTPENQTLYDIAKAKYRTLHDKISPYYKTSRYWDTMRLWQRAPE